MALENKTKNSNNNQSLECIEKDIFETAGIIVLAGLISIAPIIYGTYISSNKNKTQQNSSQQINQPIDNNYGGNK